MTAAITLIRVLHVDDDPDFGDVAGSFLEREDDRITVHTATSASEGLALLTDHEFDCIVSDYDMPGRNGIDFLETVREEHPDLPFILYTGKGSEEVASDAISVGVTDYLQKGTGTDQYTVLANRIVNSVEKYYAEQAQERNRVLVEEATDAILVVGPDATIHYATPSAESVLGRSPADLVGTSGFGPIHPDDTARVSEAFAALLDQPGGRRTEEFRYQRPDGSWMWAEARGRNLCETAVIDGVVIYARDVTERKERERALQQERDRFRAVFKKAFDAMVLADDDGQFVDANLSATELFGLPKEELLGRSIDEFVPEDFDFETAWDDFHQSDDERGTFPLVRPDGTERLVEYAATTNVVSGQHLSVLRDVTERERRERELERQTEELEELTTQLKEQYRTLFEEAPMMMILTREADGHPIIEDCNTQFVDTLGYTKETLVDTELVEFYTPESTERLLEGGGYDRSISGDFTMERRDLVTSDGSIVETLLRAVPRRDTSGEVVGTLAMYVDITEREQVKRANERLEEFTRIVSHDLRNPLNVINGRLELARAECESEHLEAIGRAHDRMDALIEDLLALAREGEQVDAVEPVSLGDVATGCWENVATADATLVTGSERSIMADRGRLQQLLENLVRNAVEHGGTDVTVTIGELADGFYVEDDGPGIPPGDREDIFEAGYSTATEGTGFGLSIVKQIVEAHDWTIQVTEGTDGGARFEVTGVEFVAE